MDLETKLEESQRHIQAMRTLNREINIIMKRKDELVIGLQYLEGTHVRPLQWQKYLSDEQVNDLVGAITKEIMMALEERYRWHEAALMMLWEVKQ